MQEFRVNYDRDLKEIWRDIYPKDYEEQINKKIEALSLKLNSSDEDKIKFNHLEEEDE